VLLTIGRKDVLAFTSRPDLSGVARMIEPPDTALPAQWKLVLRRPPFSLNDEKELMIAANITHLVTKNAGGVETVEKLAAARALGIPVVMVARPFKRQVETFHSIDAIAEAIASR
jgi:precorrin-6A/cobalt-precorrin-6A reductase